MADNPSLGAEVEEAVERLLGEYRAYCLNENADPEGWVERLQNLLEKIRQGSRPDPVAEAAIPVVMEIILREGEGRAP